MPKAKELWFLVADSEHARLLHGTFTSRGSHHVDELSRIATTYQASEHQRPTRMSRPGRAGGPGHEHEEKVAHFARDVAAWLGKEIDARKVTECTVFAPSHFLGALRKEVPKALAAKLHEQEGEIVKLTPAELAAHPRIAGLLAS
ncbi:MAG TPA: host attachment protein [Planctomycetota bacterium]|nr:host attachment protein [Planctomycetota bacterium]